MLHNRIFLYFPRENKVPNMPILSQTLKGYNSETVCPFELKFFVEMYFDQLCMGFTRGLEDQPVDRDRRVEHASLKGSTP
jgi:hypothetical protein